MKNKSVGSASASGISAEKLRKIMEVNAKSMNVYEQDRRRAKEESQKMFSDKGYVMGPSEGQNEDDNDRDPPESSGTLSAV